MENRHLSRSRFLFRAASAVMLTASAPMLAACGGKSGDTSGSSVLEQLREAGRIRVGFPNEAPAAFRQGGKLTGQNIEVARAIFEEMGIGEMEGVLATVDSLIPGLQARRFDAITAGLFITPERCRAVLFADPEVGHTQSLAVKAGNPLGLGNLEDVAETKVAGLGIVAGGVEGDYASEAGVQGGRVQQFPDLQAALEALAVERVDAVALTSALLRFTVDRLDDGRLEVTEGFLPVVDGRPEVGYSASAFRKEDRELRDAFNQRLLDFRSSGRLLEIAEPFGYTEEQARLASDAQAAEICGT